MSTAAPLKKGPKRPQRQVARLDSINNPQPRPPPQANIPRARDCPNPDCRQIDTGVDEDGKRICSLCGTVIQELNMVSELSYGLSTGGSHVVHGYHVGADQAYAKRGDVVDRSRMLNSQQMTEANGHKYIFQIGIALGMPAQLRDTGMLIFKLAIGGFIQGRRIKSVAAVALYIACRTQKETNTYMLIDFADVLQIDVFNLGHVYKTLLEHIRLNGVSWVVQPINPEDLILRFCQRLEFGAETMRVAKDAVRIVQRMNRDWMTPGRRPAGICGAALILAARMNNFRRTVREVVYVVKVQEQTIFNRLDEFKVTESSGLTVDEFRTIDLERFADPPIFTQQKEGKDGKKKRGRKGKHVEFDDDGDNDQPTVISSRASSAALSTSNGQTNTPGSSQHQAQIDSHSMPPPPLPIDPTLLEDAAQRPPDLGSSSSRAVTEPATGTQDRIELSTTERSEPESSIGKAISEPPTKRKRCRPPINTSKNPETPAAKQLTKEPAIEADITAALTDPLDIDHATALTSVLQSASDPLSPPATLQSRSHKPSEPRGPIPDSQEIFDSEFADDPEVSNCLLTPSEVAIKTRIWTHENRDYIRAQTAKLLKQQLAEENGTARTIIRRKRRKRRMGDMRAYMTEDGEEDRPVAGSPAEAVMNMLERRKFSKKLNYDTLLTIYDVSSSGASSRRASASIANSPGNGLDMLGSMELTSPGGTTKRMEGPEQAVSEAGDQDKDEQQKELESIAGELEEEINESSEEDGDPDDMFDGGGYDSE